MPLSVLVPTRPPAIASSCDITVLLSLLFCIVPLLVPTKPPTLPSPVIVLPNPVTLSIVPLFTLAIAPFWKLDEYTFKLLTLPFSPIVPKMLLPELLVFKPIIRFPLPSNLPVKAVPLPPID